MKHFFFIFCQHNGRSVLRLHDGSLHNLFQLSVSVVGPIVVLFVVVFLLQITIEPFVLYHHSGFDYMCFAAILHRY